LEKVASPGPRRGKWIPEELGIIVATAIAGAFIYFFPAGHPLRFAASLPLALLLPGLALSLWIFPTERPDPVVRLVYAFSLSVLLTLLIALVLSQALAGIAPIRLGLALGGLTFLFSGFAAIRRIRAVVRNVPDSATPKPWPILKFLIAACIVTSAATAGYVASRLPLSEQSVQMFVLGPNHTTDSLPTKLIANETSQYHFVIASLGPERTEYSLIVTLENETGRVQNLTVWSGIVSVPPDGSRSVAVNVTAAIPGNYLIRAQVSRMGGGTERLELHMHINVS